MSRNATAFLAITLVAGVLGFGGFAAGAMVVARVVFYICLALFVSGLVLGLNNRPGPTGNQSTTKN